MSGDAPAADFPEMAADLLRRALSAATASGDLLVGNRPAEVSSKSTATDVVTDLDRASEQLLIELLLADGPADGVLGEEGGERHGTSGVRWVIDPLDGTVNYVYGLPEWAVSVAAEVDGVAVAGVVHAPALRTTWWASAGGGAWRAIDGGDAMRLRVGEEQRLSHALTATGFAYDAAVRVEQGAVIAAIIGQVRDLRRPGAAAVDLCRVADGSCDAYFERGLHPWDLAAGALVVAEAGGCVTPLPRSRAANIVAANPVLFDELVVVLRAADAEVEL